MPPTCSLHPTHPTFSLPSHHAAAPPRQTVQIAPPQPNPSTIKTTFNAQLVALEEELSASDIAHEWDQFLDERRRQRRGARRRKRKKNLGFLSEDERSEDDEDDEWLFGPDRSMRFTRKQEAALSRYLQEEAMLEIYDSQMTMNSTGNIYCKSPKRINRQKVLLRARASEERIMTNFKGLVISMAADYEGCGISFEDLVQEGCVGLLRGVRKFDPKKGNKLSTYVYWWIKQAIVRAIANNSRLVRLPVNLCEATSQVMKAKSTLTSKFGRKPTYAEMAAATNLSATSVRIILQKNRKPFSYEVPLHEDARKFKDILPGPDEMSPELFVIRKLKLQSLEEVLSKLSHKEEYVIRLRYGLNCEQAQTFEDIGKVVNVSTEKARYIHMKAITKLREEKGLIECLMQQTLLTHVFH